MTIIIISLHVFVCIALIMIVLLQTGKGADMGASLGGAGSQTLFGTSGASTFLGKLTTAVAIIFMITSLYLAYSSGSQKTSSVMGDKPAVEKTAAEESATEESTTDAAKTEASADKTTTDTTTTVPADNNASSESVPEDTKQTE